SALVNELNIRFDALEFGLVRIEFPLRIHEAGLRFCILLVECSELISLGHACALFAQSSCPRINLLQFKEEQLLSGARLHGYHPSASLGTAGEGPRIGTAGAHATLHSGEERCEL